MTFNRYEWHCETRRGEKMMLIFVDSPVAAGWSQLFRATTCASVLSLLHRAEWLFNFFFRAFGFACDSHTHRCHTFSNIYQDQNWIRRKRRINVYGYIYIYSICSPTRPSNSRYAYLIYWNAWALKFIGSSSWKRGWSTILICILWHRRVLYMYIDSILMIIILLIWQIECEN